MAMAIRWPTRITESVLLELSRMNAGTFELTSDGTILMSPPTGSAASLGESALHKQVCAWSATAAPDALVLPPTGGITLPDGSIWAPDTTWIKRATFDRMSREDRERAFWRLVPDAVFEVFSPSDDPESEAARYKLAAYRANEIPLIVLIDPRSGVTRCFRRGADAMEIRERAIDLGPEMPGFVLDVGTIVSRIV